jgi:rhomboid protease GluP
VSTPPQPLIDQLQNRVPRVPVTLWLIAANIAVFVIMLGFGAGLWHGNNNVQLVPTSAPQPKTANGGVWAARCFSISAFSIWR